MRRKSLSWIVISKIMGLMVFLLMLFLVNFFNKYIENPIYSNIVAFINRNAVLLVVMSLVFLVGEVFNALFFPFNLPAPIFNSVAAVMLVKFMLRMFSFIDQVMELGITDIFAPAATLIYTLIFFIVIIAGYVSIFHRLLRHTRSKEKPVKTTVRRTREKKAKDWEDIGNEFRGTISDILAHIRDSINK
ncbi:hypothetical protein JW930_02170 [Candidatus Woesearchaeota archaeon]|nr:hypothetical protein [Candidatus Woesearchaeota archaeon]